MLRDEGFDPDQILIFEDTPYPVADRKVYDEQQSLYASIMAPDLMRIFKDLRMSRFIQTLE